MVYRCGFSRIRLALSQVFPGLIQLKQKFTLLWVAKHALCPGDGHQAFTGCYFIDVMQAGRWISHGVTGSQFEALLAE